MRIMKLIITCDYWIYRPSLALNPCKKYQISYESLHIYFCTCTRNKYPCKSEIVWNVDAMLKIISFSILNITYNFWIWRPSLALNPSKKYQIIYESVHIYLCTCMRNKYPCKSEIVWNVQVVLKVISVSILNMHELVETWLPEP